MNRPLGLFVRIPVRVSPPARGNKLPIVILCISHRIAAPTLPIHVPLHFIQICRTYYRSHCSRILVKFPRVRMLACELATSIPAEKLFIPSFKLTEHFVPAICFSTSLENRGDYCGRQTWCQLYFLKKILKKKPARKISWPKALAKFPGF